MLRRVGIACGVLAPVLWAAGIAICAALRPQFSHYTAYISELGERGSSTELVMRYAVFLPTGLMHIAFAASLPAAFRGNRVAAVAAILIGINGLARIGAGLFPCEAGCGGPAELLSQRLHTLSGAVGFGALIAAVVLWSVVFRRDPRLRHLTAYCVAASGLGTVFLLLMISNAEPGGARGLFERLSSGVLSLWIMVFAAHVWRISDAPRDV